MFLWFLFRGRGGVWLMIALGVLLPTLFVVVIGPLLIMWMSR